MAVKIYGLVCPKSGQIRYIGKTNRALQTRLYAHITESRRERHSHKHRWIANCCDAGTRPTVWLLEEVPGGVSWQDRERAWIKRALEIGLELTNQTGGGEGLDFLDLEAKRIYCEKLSVSVKRAQLLNPKGLEATARAARRSWAENRDGRIAACMAGWTEESKAKHRATMSVVSKTPQFKAAKSRGSKKMWERDRGVFMAAFANPECKLKQSESKKKAWKDPDKRDRLMNRWTPEARAKQAEALRERQAKIQAAMTPEVRARQAAKLKETWAKRKAGTL